MPQDYDFDQLFPGRFIKAALLKNKMWTLTVTDIQREEMPDKKGKDGKSKKVVLSFKETDLQLILNKLNGIAIKLMFGENTRGWRGKRITFYPETGKWFGKKQQALRVWGSYDIAADIRESALVGQEQEEFFLRKLDPKKKAEAPPPPKPEPVMEEEALDMDPTTGEVFDAEAEMRT